MLYWSAIFFVIALIAAVFGFSGSEPGVMTVGKQVFFVFLVLFVIAFVLALVSKR